MAAQQDASHSIHTTSSGTALASTGWLDVHFEASRPEYEAQVRAVGIEPGWHVLDAATGGGSYLPWLAELVGAKGQLAAIDLAPENLDAIKGRLASWALPCPVELQLGDVRSLPYPSARFDAVWFANTSQYFSDDELLAILAEFRRVTRPGGLVAVKDSSFFDVVHPLPPYLLARHGAAVCVADDVDGRRLRNVFHRTPTLRPWLERAGLAEIWQRYTAIERWSPFAPAEQQVLCESLTFLGAMAEPYGLSAADQDIWAQVSNPSSPANPINSPEGYYREGNILAVGRVPE